MGKLNNNTKYQIFMMYVLVVLMLTGNIISSHRRILGIVISLYRVFIPATFILLIGIRVYRKTLRENLKNRMLFLYCGLMALWILWGIGLIFFSPYVNVYEALKDIVALMLGMASIYCFVELCNNEYILEKVFNCIRIVCLILCAWAFVEIVAGLYLPFSKAYWLQVAEKQDWLAIILQALKEASVYPTTTIFYNTNDFSVFLAVFLPLFYIKQDKSKKENIFSYIAIFIILFIISVNDSNIVIISVFFAVILNFLLSKDKKKAGKLVAFIFIFLSFGNKLICSFLIMVKSHLPFQVPLAAKQYGSIMELTKIKKMLNVKEVVEIQVSDAMGGSANSLMCRWEITLSSLRMTAKSKFMGVGPSGFANYIEKHEKESLLINPHNWWLEILSQYGIIIFILYLAVMAWIFVLVWRIYRNSLKHIDRIYLCMCLTFCIACIAPSNYLKCTYQWMLPAIGICIISLRKTETTSEQKKNTNEK